MFPLSSFLSTHSLPPCSLAIIPFSYAVFGIKPGSILNAISPAAMSWSKICFDCFDNCPTLVVLTVPDAQSAEVPLFLPLFCSSAPHPSSISRLTLVAGGNQSLRSWSSEGEPSLCSGDLWLQGGSTLLIFPVFCFFAPHVGVVMEVDGRAAINPAFLTRGLKRRFPWIWKVLGRL